MKEGILSIYKTDGARATPHFDIGYSILDILLFSKLTVCLLTSILVLGFRPDAIPNFYPNCHHVVCVG